MKGKKTDLATVIGLLGATGVVLASLLLSGGLPAYADLPSAILVLGGSLFVVMAKFGLPQFVGAFRVALNAFVARHTDHERLIDELVDIAVEARRNGLLSLEGRETSDNFLDEGVQLMVDGHDPESLRAVLGRELQQAMHRHESGQAIFLAVAEVAPAIGMIGTLVGLVAMLGGMDDPKSIGPAMAVALLTTLYGALIANMVALPIADKLKLRRAEEARCKRLIIDGLVAMQLGQNPRVIEGLLRTYLPASQRS